MAAITVTHHGCQTFLVQARQHTWLADQPAGAGDDLGPTPVEMLVGSLASCAAHYAVGYLRENRLPYQRLRLECRWTMRQDPARLGRVRLSVHPPTQLTDDQRAGLLAAVDQCTVHNSLREPPEVAVVLAEPARTMVTATAGGA